ncbi:MAG: protein-glutamate O-methyltransferase family protein [Spirochaetales bacterium]|nr:protein-glutamate O-methyltransferase family protein [Spirochaetales bacterium]
MDATDPQQPSCSPAPPLLSTDDPGSFAQRTLRVRLPEQLDQLLTLDRLDPRAGKALRALKHTLRRGRVRDLLREQPEVAAGMLLEERTAWQREIAPRLGRPWSAIPWYFAESLFYLEILAACGYYHPDSAGFGQDPFEPFKTQELHRPQGGIARAGKVLRQADSLSDPEARLALYLLHSLWGNRMDLTFGELVRRYGSTEELGGRDELLIDHSPAVARRALAARRVDLVLDNAGTELVCDLLLARVLLDRGVMVRLHVKASPFYVSDAMAKEVHATVAALAGHSEASTRRAGNDLRDALRAGSLVVMPHWFWNGPLMYSDWPEEIRRGLEGLDLALFKGDVNYRRLLGDRRWDPQTPMEELTRYVPCPFAVLRTLKSEVAADLPRQVVDALSAEDPQWSVSGRYGLIRLRP